jgi:hypothetical protein
MSRERILAQAWVEAAGLVQLNGADRYLAEVMAKAVSMTFNGDIASAKGLPAKPSDLNKIIGYFWRLLRRENDRHEGTRLGIILREGGHPITLKNRSADAKLYNVKFYLYWQGGSAAGTFYPDEANAAIHIDVAVLVYGFLQGGPLEVSEQALVAHMQRYFAHEIRHAADWAYQLAGGVKDPLGSDDDLVSLQQLRKGPDKDTYWSAYINSPTELKSWAGDMALRLYQLVGDDALSMSGKDFVDYMTWGDVGEKFKYVRPENKQRFLQMVHSEVRQLAQGVQSGK